MTVHASLTVKDLPAPPAGKTGWPWTTDHLPLPARMPDGSEWPRISIVTPSYNYGRFIEETIRSVLLQGYPNLEYIIIDGGSTDETVEIIKKYEPFLTHWVSEPDQGQTDAINKGYQRCTGEVFVWLNSDDAYRHPDCLRQVGELYRQGYQVIIGGCQHVDVHNQPTQLHTDTGFSKPQTFSQYVRYWSCVHLPQPAVFIQKALTDRAFPLNTALYWSMDYQFFLRIFSYQPNVVWTDHRWVSFKVHGANKTMNSNFNICLELYETAIAEAKRVYPAWRSALFEVAAKDYLVVQSLIGQPHSKVLQQLIQRPSLVQWPLFWKILGKSLLGNSSYTAVKKLIGRA